MKPDMPLRSPTVFIVDDEPSVRESLTWLLNSIQLPVACFDSAASFLAGYRHGSRGCLILDVRMPGMSGIELMESLGSEGVFLPIIFLSAHGDIPMATHAMRMGAIDFLSKPYNNEQFLRRVRQALALDSQQWEARERRASLSNKYAALTKREQQLLNLIVGGSSNKDIARKLDISIKTVEAHRARLIKKLAVKSLAELVQFGVEYRQYHGLGQSDLGAAKK
jgi:two-component system, LuxR family, response regulator TtrR